MHSNQWITLFAIICVTFVGVHLVSAGGGGHGHGHHGHGGHGHGHGGWVCQFYSWFLTILSCLNRRGNQTQCYQALQFLNQWFPQSPLIAAFQTVCGQVGVAQAWSNLQSLLGVPVTG